MTLFNVQTKRRGRGFLADGVALTGVVSTLLLFRFLRFAIGVSTSAGGGVSSVVTGTAAAVGVAAATIRLFFNSAHNSSQVNR